MPVPVLSSALFERFSSRGEADFADKLLSAMRYEFGADIWRKPARLGAVMQIEVFATPERAAKGAAQIVAAEARDAVAKRGRFTVAFSGGHTPWLMLRALADEEVPWDKVHIVPGGRARGARGRP